MVPLYKRAKETLESFDYQWKNLSEGAYLLSDDEWRENVSDHILEELELGREEISGRRVLDAGCGNGRWAYGFMELGCEVHGFDPSEHGVSYARAHVQKGSFNVANVLDYPSLLKLYPENSFDVVWCWGVLHHTGDPELGFKNLTKFVKPGGILHLYMYGRKPSWNRYLRRFFSLFPLRIREFMASLLAMLRGSSTHSNFDMFSTPIVSSHTESEIKGWYIDEGFSFERVYPSWASGSTDIFTSGFKRP